MVYFPNDMPPHFFPTEATLDEVLFVLGEPLCEEEVWAILLCGGIALIGYFEKAAHAHQIHYLLPAINPDTLLLGIDGSVNFLTKKPENVKDPRPVPLLNFDDKHFVSPEAISSDVPCCQPRNSKTALEKMFIYSLGMCMLTALRHRTALPLEDLISVDLQACLSIMVEESIITRICAESLKKVSLKHTDFNRASLRVKRMSKEILDSVETLTGSTSTVLLPSPLGALLTSKKSEKHIRLSHSKLKLPTPDKSKKKSRHSNSFEHENLLLPASPKEALMKEEKSYKYFSSPKHIDHVQSLSSLSMSKTNDSVDMSRAIHSSTPSEPLTNSNKLTLEYNGIMTTTVVIADGDSTLDSVDQSRDDISIEYLPILRRNEPAGASDGTIVLDTTEDVMVIEEERILGVTGLQISDPVSHKPPAYVAPTFNPAFKRFDSARSTVSPTSLQSSHRSSITSPTPVSNELHSTQSPPASPISALPMTPPITPSPSPSPMVLSPVSSPVNLSPVSAKTISISESSVSATPISPTSMNPSPVPPIIELNRMSSIEDLSAKKCDESMTSIEFSTQKEESMTSIEFSTQKEESLPSVAATPSPLPSSDRGLSTVVTTPSPVHSFDKGILSSSADVPNVEEVPVQIQGQASSPPLSPVYDDKEFINKSLPSLPATPSPVPSSDKGSLASARRHSVGSYGRHSVGSYGTVASSKNSSISQVSLTQGAYSLDKGLNMELEYPLSRFKSGGGLSLCGLSQTSLPYARSLDGSRREFDVPQAGPEFVRVPSDPTTGFVDITPVRLGPLPKKIRLISVILLNAQEIQTQVQVNSKGKELFEQIATHIGLKESLYFGLALLEDGEHMFIDLDEKLAKYAPLGWKDEGNKKKKGEFVLHFKVKFFLEFPRAIKHNLTSHFYYLHLRKAIITGYTHCSDDSLLLRLGGYALQAEYGDFISDFGGYEYFRLEHYLPPYMLSRIGHNDLYCNLVVVHQTLSGKSQVDAEMGFLDEVTNVEEYGVLFHKVSRSKDNPADSVLLGICINGIIIKEHKRNQRKLVHQQSWDSIKKFYFEKKQFKLKSKTPEDANAKMIFFTSHYRKSKYLFKMCQSFHRFQIFNQPISKQSMKLKEQHRAMQSTFSDPLHNNKVYNTLKGSEYSNLSFKSAEMKISNEIKFVQQENAEQYSERSVDVLKNATESACDKDEATDEVPIQCPEDTPQLQLERNATYQKDSVLADNVEITDTNNVERTSPRSIYSDDESAYTDSELSDFKQAYLQGRPHVDVVENVGDESDQQNLSNHSSYIPQSNDISNRSSSSVSRGNSGYCQQFGMNLKRMSGMDNLDGISPEGSFRSYVGSEGNNSLAMYASASDHFEEVSLGLKATPDRESPRSSHEGHAETVEIHLEKKDGSYGFSITGGLDSDHLMGGVYIKSLLPNGAASMSGKMKAGYRLLSVNGVSLENVTHAKAVEILKNAPTKTLFEMSRATFSSKSQLLAKLQHLKDVNSQEVLFEADLEKEEGGLGLCLAGGKGSDLVFRDQLMIRKIFPGLPIARCGKFQVGDILIAINDKMVEGMTHQEALSTIRNSQKRVSLIAKRPNPNDIPDELFMTSRPVSPQEIMRDIRR